MNKATKAQIRNVLAIFISAILCAGVLAAYMIFRYGPTGRYIAGNTILSPYILDQVNYPEASTGVGKGVKYIFNGIEFSYYDKAKNKQNSKVDSAVYEQFYLLIEKEKSLENIPIDIESQFNRLQPALLTVMMRSDPSQTQQSTMIFQAIEFVETDYFRVQLRDKESNGSWAYFYRPHIYQDVLELFTKKK